MVDGSRMVAAVDLTLELKELVLVATGPEKHHKSITSQAMAAINTSARFEDDQRQETLVVVVRWMVSVKEGEFQNVVEVLCLWVLALMR
jgi:hypothetical protein